MKFPTMAEQALAEWQSLTKTTPFKSVAKLYGATRDDTFGLIEYVFDDDSIVAIKGRGNSHTISAELP